MLDASAMPLWEPVLIEPSSQSLTLDEGVTATANAQSGDWTYTSSGTTVTITGYTGAGGAVDIPAQLAGLPVVAIGAWAFSKNTTVTSVSIPASVTSIGTAAFDNCTALTSISMQSGMKSIGTNAFFFCTGLTSVSIPASVTSIGASAFYSCTGLTAVSIPASVTTIGSSAFRYCTKLTAISVDILNTAYASVDGVLYDQLLMTLIQCPAAKPGSVSIPASVTSIMSYAFENCTNVTSVNMPTGVTSIGSYAFQSCKSLTTFTIPAGVTSISDGAFYSCTGLTSVSIPASITTIGTYAFRYCTSLTSVTIPASVTGLGSYAFGDCTSFTSVNIPASVTTIGGNAFYNCTELSAISVDTASTAYASLDGVLYDKLLTKVIQCPAAKGGSVSIPSGVTSIVGNAFYGCTSLTSVSIPASVTTIGGNAFYGCTSLTSVSIPASVTTIGSYAFYNCTRLTAVGIPTGVKTIDQSTFFNCTALASVSLPSTLTTIGSAAFSGCQSLASISIPSSVTTIGASAFYNCNSLTGIIIPAGVKTVEKSTFDGCTALASVSLPATLTTIVSSAFSGCQSLASISIPASVTSIEDSAFYGCQGLTGVTIPASVTNIGNSVFVNCKNLSAITVASANTRFASFDGVLYNKSLTTWIFCPEGKGTVVIASGLTGLPIGAFKNCTELTTVNVPASMTYIDGNQFKATVKLKTITVDPANAALSSRDGVLYNKSFTKLIRWPTSAAGSISIPSGVTETDGNVFSGCTEVSAISIPSTVTLMQVDFSGCPKLTAFNVDQANTRYSSVDGVLYKKDLTVLERYPMGKTMGAGISIPAGVGSISYYAFAECTGITSVDFPSSMTGINSSAFSGCTGLKSISLPAGVRWIGSSAFSRCDGLTTVSFLGDCPQVASGGGGFSGGPATIYRLPNASGWTSTFDGRPVQIFQPLNASAGQALTSSIDPTTDRVLKQGLGTAILNSPSTRTGGTVVEAGELVVQHKDALGSGLLEVQAGAKATLQTGYDTVSITSLSLANTSRLEIGTGKLAIAANGFTESDIRTKLIAGRGDGSWNGTGGITSTFAGVDRAIGYRVLDAVMEVAYAAPGDSNLDGVLDILDLSEILSAGKFNTGASANWAQGDTNYDGAFDILDISEILGTNLFNEGTYLTQPAASSAAADAGSVSTFDQALVFAALAMETGDQPVVKRKSL